MTIDFTVAIPTYNGAQRLPILLDKLRSQVNPDSISWEILIVDNNSSDDTTKVVQEAQTRWASTAPLRYCFEPEQGAAFARHRAVRESRGELVGFLDDDVLPASDWLAAAHTFAHCYPKAGAYSGQIHGEFEVEPPEHFEKIRAFLSIREYGSQPKQFIPDRLQLPTAAALIVRRQAWCESVPDRPVLKGRIGNSFLGGEDYEPLLHLYRHGWEIWYGPTMHSYHQIPKHRLERSYLIALAYGCGLATCQLRMINANGGQKPIIFLRTLLGNLRRIIAHMIRYRSELRTNLVAASEISFFWGGMMSPFYYLNKSLQNQLSSKKTDSTD
jgi:glycosyltransferase involved in cell wall biosynthesis